MFKIGVFSIIFNEKKEVLLCHRRDFDLWNLPGGGLKANESPWKGVIRETKEETGFKIKIDKLVGIYHKPRKDTVVFSFLGSITGGKLTLNKEADEIRFFSLDSLPKNISEKHTERIIDASRNPKKIILKSQHNPDYSDIKK
ncbi:MAG: NUDIX domain-containing protein [Patescibacteria group bacterium]|nr:NUDIX domain-containing protein [Patescibacteria group bacterium]